MSQIESKKPTHGVFITKSGKDQKTFWSRIGGAWEHKDGNGFFMKIDTLPVNGEIVVRKNQPKSKPQSAA